MRGVLMLIVSLHLGCAAGNSATQPVTTSRPPSPAPVAATKPVRSAPPAPAAPVEPPRISFAEHLTILDEVKAACDPMGRRTVTADVNGDGSIDVWKIYVGGFLVCKQVDLSHDGSVDYWAVHASNGKRVFEQFDFDFDGRPDAASRFDPGTGVKQVVFRDSDMDGTFDVVEVYDSKGALSEVQRDRNGDGAADVWEQYTGGTLRQVAFDDDYDGEIDRREKRPKP